MAKPQGNIKKLQKQLYDLGFFDVTTNKKGESYKDNESKAVDGKWGSGSDAALNAALMAGFRLDGDSLIAPKKVIASQSPSQESKNWVQKLFGAYSESANKIAQNKDLTNKMVSSAVNQLDIKDGIKSTAADILKNTLFNTDYVPSNIPQIPDNVSEEEYLGYKALEARIHGAAVNRSTKVPVRPRVSTMLDHDLDYYGKRYNEDGSQNKEEKGKGMTDSKVKELAQKYNEFALNELQNNPNLPEESIDFIKRFIQENNELIKNPKIIRQNKGFGFGCIYNATMSMNGRGIPLNTMLKSNPSKYGYQEIPYSFDDLQEGDLIQIGRGLSGEDKVHHTMQVVGFNNHGYPIVAQVRASSLGPEDKTITTYSRESLDSLDKGNGYSGIGSGWWNDIMTKAGSLHGITSDGKGQGLTIFRYTGDQQDINKWKKERMEKKRFGGTIHKYQEGTGEGGVQLIQPILNGNKFIYDWDNPDSIPDLPARNDEAVKYNALFTPDVTSKLYDAYKRNYGTLTPKQRKEFYGMLVPSDDKGFIYWGDDYGYTRNLPSADSGAVKTLRDILSNLSVERQDKLLHTDWRNVPAMTAALGVKNAIKLSPYIMPLSKFRMKNGGNIKKRF